jgi:hypothetical protein
MPSSATEKTMQRVWNILKQWLPLAAVVFALCGLVYVVAQQVLRQSANDPQIQMAQDTAAALAAGEPAAQLVPSAQVEISQSLAPVVMIFDDQGEVLASSARLHGQIPSLPPGLLDYVRAHGEDRVTWQPESGVRLATVIVRAEGAHPGFVLAGRSLGEVEKRVSQIELLSGLGLAAILGASLVIVIFCELALPSERKPQAA